MAERNEYLTAEEVMEHLQLGRTFVYEQARLYLATGGAQGLPCRRFGRLLRFPLAEIEAHGCLTHETRVGDLALRRRSPAAPTTKPAQTKPATQRASTRRATSTGQSALPFSD